MLWLVLIIAYTASLFILTKANRELPTSKIGLMITLPCAQAPFDNILEFPGVIPCAGAFGHGKMGLDHIMYVPQYGCSPLLDILRRIDIERPVPSQHHRTDILCRNFRLHFVAPDIGKLNWIDHMNAVNMPSQSRMPINGFQNAACRRRSHDVIGNPFHLHFGSGKASVLSPDLHLNCHLFHSFLQNKHPFLSE